MIEAILLLLIIAAFFQKFGKKWIFHLIINLVMYLFYIGLWIVMFVPKDPNEHHGDSALGFALFTLISVPFYLMFNIFSILHARKIFDKRIENINKLGLAICILHVLIFCGLLII